MGCEPSFQFPELLPSGSGMHSCAFGLPSQAASDSRTSFSNESSGKYVAFIDPTEPLMIEAIDRPVPFCKPLVVEVLFAHRRFALADSRASTTISSAFESSRIFSIFCWMFNG
jgi:hypothetical protein